MELVIRYSKDIYGNQIGTNGLLASRLQENPEAKYVTMVNRQSRRYNFKFNDSAVRQLFVDVLYRYNLLPTGVYTYRRASEDYPEIAGNVFVRVPENYKPYLSDIYNAYWSDSNVIMHDFIWGVFKGLLEKTRHQHCDYFLLKHRGNIKTIHCDRFTNYDDLETLYQSGLSRRLSMYKYTNYQEVLDNEFGGKRYDHEGYLEFLERERKYSPDFKG